VRHDGAAPALFAALLASILCCASNSFSGIDEPDFGEVVRHYRTLAPHRALALATEANGRWAYGAHYAGGSREQATQGALEACESRARSGGMIARCFPFAVDDEPAPETVRDCLARKLPSRRCQMQRQHRGDLTAP
jgi:hypothetical protein